MRKKNKELTFEDFQKLAKNKTLALPEKIGFPSSYREDYYDDILQDIFQNTLLIKKQKSLYWILAAVVMY